MNKHHSHLLVGVEDRIPLYEAVFLGLQHVLAMDLYIVPIILAGILAFTVTETAFLIQMTFIAAGLATIIQAGFGMRLPVMQGPSYVPIGAVAAIGASQGMGAVAGSLIPGAIILGLLGYPFKILGKIVNYLIPPIVGGTVIIVVGIGLMPIALTNIYSTPGSVGVNGLIAAVSAALLVFFIALSGIRGGIWQHFRLVSVILALIGGTMVASFFGVVNFGSVAAASWFSLPGLFPFGSPTFDLSAIMTMIFIYFVVLVETTGTWFAVEAVTGSELTHRRLNGGAVGEGVGCLVAAVLGTAPVTGYSTNAGVISITGVGSRWAIIAGGVILILLGLIPKLMSVIASIPGPVISGVFAVVTVVIFMNGFRTVQHEELTERNILVIGLPVLLTLAAVLMPKEILYGLPSLLNFLVSSGIAVGALAAVLFNLIIPRGEETRYPAKNQE